MSVAKNRNFGLDCVRALAILLVLFDNSGYFFILTPNDSNKLFIFGFYGVELFFVLSGFLVGEIILRQFSSGFSFKDLQQFYLRRWLRTLPLYYLVLVLYVIADSFKNHQLNLHFLHFLFLQNFSLRESEFFRVSWSLSIEEWFYLLLPLLFIFYIKSHRSPKWFLRILLTIILGIFLLRCISIGLYNPSFDALRIFIPLRFDSLLIGVLLAYIKMHYKKAYALVATGSVFFAAVILLLISATYFLSLYLTAQLTNSIVFRSIGFSIVSILFACMIPFFANNTVINNVFSKKNILYKAVTNLSVLSYSLYLVHLELFTFFIVVLHGRIPSIILFAITATVTLLTSIILHNTYEKPIMDVRDKLSSVKFSKILSFGNFTKATIRGK